jgi:hypothetical protein
LPPGNSKNSRQEFRIIKGRSALSVAAFKQIGKLWSVRVGKQYRALGLDKKDAIVWFWIGTHADYDKLIK